MQLTTRATIELALSGDLPLAPPPNAEKMEILNPNRRNIILASPKKNTHTRM